MHEGMLGCTTNRRRVVHVLGSRNVCDDYRGSALGVLFMVRTLLSVAVAAMSLGACTHASTVALRSPIVSADQANPSPLVKLEAFGYRRGNVRTGFAPVVFPQIPQGSDLVVRGRFTNAGLQSDLGTARVLVIGTGRVATESLPRGPRLELLVPASKLKAGVYAAAVEMVPKLGTARTFEKPIAFEVDSAPAPIPRRVAKSTAALQGGIDIIDSLSDQPPRRVDNPVLQRGESLLVEGWAYDPPAHSSASTLLIVVDGKDAFQAEYGISRPDVATYYEDETHRNVGFAAIIPASAFSAGSHRLDLMVLSKDGRHYYSLPKPSPFSLR